MPIAGEVILTTPERCSRGCHWGPPRGGVALVTTGWQPCSCATARRNPSGHHWWACQRPGCDGLVMRPPCSGKTGEVASYAERQ